MIISILSLNKLVVILNRKVFSIYCHDTNWLSRYSQNTTTHISGCRCYPELEDIWQAFFFLKRLLFFLFNFIYLFIYWLCWVFVSVPGLSLVAASGGHSSSRCAGLSLSRPLLLWSTGSRRAGAVVVAHGPSCSAACGIFPDQGSNPCALHWQADSQPLRHQGSPIKYF